jgi:sugar phosphate isomerase/epimerase
MSQKFAICNETFGDRKWHEVCRFVAETGYEGIEIAPFTFGKSVEEISARQRSEIRAVAEDCGLEIVGLHWLLLTPEGLHLHSKDEVVRVRTRDYLRSLTHFAGDIGARVMILGSPKQRKLEEGDVTGSWELTQQTIRDVLPDLQERGVILCQESLPPPEADFILTAGEAAKLVQTIDHPNYRLMLDTKSMCAEDSPPATIIREFCHLIEHYHANDANRRGPGFGNTDFRPIAQALTEEGYPGYVSVEVFDYTPDPETIARESLRYLREVFS